MSEDSDKTEEPTDHKLQEARKKGQVFKSQDITSTIMLFTCFFVLSALGGWMFKEIAIFTRELWGNMLSYTRLEDKNMFLDTLNITLVYMKVLLPLLAACFVAGILANIAQVKFLFSLEPLKPSLSKINPIQGFKKIFSMKSVMELAKQIMKVAIIGWIAYKGVINQLGDLVKLVMVPTDVTVMVTRDIISGIIKQVIVGMVVVSIIDYIFQKKQFMKDMKMSMQELKDEYKDTEGNPQVKGKLRQLMRQASQRAMSEGVPQSTAIVTNPTHLAVGIRYEPGVDEAPIVTAKGERLMAQQIKLMAEDHDIPIVENVELARALFAACEPNQPIPPELYKATAEVLAYIFKLKKKKLAKQRRAKAMQAKKRAAAGRR